MDFNTAIDLIIRELREAEEIIGTLGSGDDMSRISVELARSKCRNVSGIISMLKELQAANQNLPAETRDPGPVSSENAPEPPEREEPAKKAQVVEKTENITEPAHPVPEEKIVEIETREEKIKEEVIPTGETRKKQSESSSIIADSFGTAENRLNEKLGRRDDQGYSDIVKNKPVINLSKAIGINDKFLFIRELFKSDPVMYEKALDRIEKASSFTEASGILLEYTSETEGNKIADQFLSIVKRKFAQ